jgi:hypothetical protein
MDNTEKFYNYCRNKIYSRAKNMLASTPDLDLLHNNGNCFFFVIQDNNPEMLQSLINYYLRGINIVPEERTIEENIRVYRLKEVIEDIEQQIDIPENIQEIIKPYSSYYAKPDSDTSDDEIDIESSFDDLSAELVEAAQEPELPLVGDE